jgi:VanZ family protein
MLKPYNHPRILWFMLTAWATFALILVTLPGDNVVMRAIFSVIDHIWHFDILLHTALFASLTLTLWIMFRQWVDSRHVLLVAMALALIAGTLTEWSQLYVAERSVTVGDMMGNWLGVFVAGFVVSYFVDALVIDKL